LPFCHQCRYELKLGIEKFCPKCGHSLNNGHEGPRLTSVNVTDTKCDVFGTGFIGDKNIIAKDIKGI
jgi:hypothetical protein